MHQTFTIYHFTCNKTHTWGCDVFLLLFSISSWGNMTDMMRFYTPWGNLSVAHPAAELIWKYRVTQALLHTGSHTAFSALAISYHPKNKKFVKAEEGYASCLFEVNLQQRNSYVHQTQNETRRITFHPCFTWLFWSPYKRFWLTVSRCDLVSGPQLHNGCPASCVLWTEPLFFAGRLQTVGTNRAGHQLKQTHYVTICCLLGITQRCAQHFMTLVRCLSGDFYQQTAGLHTETGCIGTERLRGLVIIHTDVCQAPESISCYFRVIADPF